MLCLFVVNRKIEQHAQSFAEESMEKFKILLSDKELLQLESADQFQNNHLRKAIIDVLAV